jgi:NAD+ synthase (glutamine-hydrolysing)
METYGAILKEPFQGYPQDVTEENIQSRIRGNLLMALSNKFGSMLLTTGNKSEMSVGYCTLYGDMNGGLAVIADLPKMMVYRVPRWRNRRSADIPESILTKAPSAELRPDQTDQDSLPAIRSARRNPREACRAEPVGRRDHRAGIRRGDGAEGAAAGAHRGI